MVNDPIADFLTRLRNGLMARKKGVVTNSSKMLRTMAEILQNNGYIKTVQHERQGFASKIRIELKYDSQGKPMAEGFKRISKPGLRQYRGSKDLPSVRGGMGIAIVSTSKGVMTEEQARKLNVGGEILCHVW